ncbi:hypothetical protein D3OALGA1CA_2692 [Olavius algarvensis associated proteobacterium Delta 3]|nr:hypothetical protein D3OALGB2SA_2650 [Olavius algarvensis associated proteobacterium Delta 3]CAB5122889.1 hypothetical protein D3OALGA1CA_2692 [Olavius algarvensis associated proteobacterium Delta 3]
MNFPVSLQQNKRSVLGIVALTLFIVAYYPIFQILVKKWASSEEYSHAFVILPIILYLVWQKRAIFQESQVRYSSVGLVLLIISALFYPVSLLIQMRTIIALFMFLTVVGTIIYLFGTDTLKALFTPLLLLAMLIPVPEKLFIQLTFPLQLIVSQISEVVIRFFAVPILREGNIMFIPGKTFEVVEACSGLRSMISLLTLSVIFGYFRLRKVSSKLVLVVASAPTAIFVNIIRVVTMILLFHFFKLDLSEGTLHTLTGISIFAIALLTLFLVERILEKWEIKSNSN